MSELQPVVSWEIAKMSSKGYLATDLLDDLCIQFINNLEERFSSNQQDKFQYSARQNHLLTALSYVFPRLPRNSDIQICDLGGGSGYMFDWLVQHFNLDFKDPIDNLNRRINYSVYETASIAKRYRDLGKALPIMFLENSPINYPPTISLSIISCTLQYIEDYYAELEFLKSRSQYTLIMRVPIIDCQENKIFVQTFSEGIYAKSNSSWPIRFFSKTQFDEDLQKLFDVIFVSYDYEETIPFGDSLLPVQTFLLKSK